MNAFWFNGNFQPIFGNSDPKILNFVNKTVLGAKYRTFCPFSWPKIKHLLQKLDFEQEIVATATFTITRGN